MRLIKGSYNVPHIVIEDEVTAGTPTVVGTKKEFLNLAAIVKESGTAIIDYVKISGNVMNGSINIIRFTGDDNDGFDFGTVTNFHDTPSVVSGTLLVDGNDVKLTVQLTEV